MADSVDAFINEIKSDIKEAAAWGMYQSFLQTKKGGQKEFDSFYSQGKPKLYKRTYQLKHSFSTYPVTGVGFSNMWGGDTMTYSVYIKEPHYGDNENRQTFIKRGYPSTLDGFRVINAANEGYGRTYGILGKPHFWDRTLELTEKNLDTCMRQAINEKFG